METTTPAVPAHGVGAARHKGLDAIRCLAIMLVIVHHVGLRFPASVQDPVSRFLVSIGWGGVDIFFAISGFLITRILLRDSSTGAVSTFFRKRVVRIIPLYFVSLLVYALSSIVMSHETGLLSRLWINAAFLTGWAIPFLGEAGVPFTISWSLSVEEFAYVVFGAVALLGRRALVWSLLLLVVLCPLVRAAMVYPFQYPPLLIYYFVPGRLDALALGGVLAAFPALADRLGRAPWWLPIAAVGGLLSALTHAGRITAIVAVLGYSAVGVAAAWLVACVSRLPETRQSVLLRASGSVGLVSYFIYLFHLFAIAALVPLLRVLGRGTPPSYVLVIVVTAATYLLARLSWRYFEVPLMRLVTTLPGPRT